MARPFVIPLFLLLILPARSAWAVETYDEILAKAQQILATPRPGEPADARIDRALSKAAEAVRLDDSRWEGWFFRGLCWCQKAVATRRLVRDAVNAGRARGDSEALLAQHERVAREFIAQSLQQAYRDFSNMQIRMRRKGIVDVERRLFAEALMKYAGREYLHAKGGARGAIGDLKELLRRGFLEEHCGNLIAQCYLDLGLQAYDEADYARAQAFWEKGLKFARTPALRETLLTNMAGAYELDNSFGLAEKVIRRQIDEDPDRPLFWKNLGLVLGYEGRLKEALLAYAKARELCEATRDEGFFRGYLHGNAWLRAAMIHGKLLEADGDLREAWRLFFRYREMFGDDYNFCVAFGDFCLQMGRYDLARRFLEHAKAQQPLCPLPYQLLVQVASRLPGKPDDRRERIEKARKDFEEARRRFVIREESPVVRRICAGLQDLGDPARPGGRSPKMDPDPLAGFDADAPPEWILEAAKTRSPFVPHDPEKER